MKITFLFALLTTALWACKSDSENVTHETTAVISNQTDLDIVIWLNLGSATEFITANALSKITGYSSAQSVSGPEIMILNVYDSIDVIFSNEKTIKFFPDSTVLPSGKNMYDSADWEIKDDTVAFYITQEDLDFAQ